jgi:hypothetical protein
LLAIMPSRSSSSALRATADRASFPEIPLLLYRQLLQRRSAARMFQSQFGGARPAGPHRLTECGTLFQAARQTLVSPIWESGMLIWAGRARCTCQGANQLLAGLWPWGAWSFCCDDPPSRPRLLLFLCALCASARVTLNLRCQVRQPSPHQNSGRVGLSSRI